MLDLDVDPLPEGYIPLRVVALIECFTPEGARSLVLRCSKDNMVWDNIGFFETALTMERRAAVDCWEDDDG